MITTIELTEESLAWNDTINVDLLREGLTYITLHPDEHDQGAWGYRVMDARGKPCGTRFCLAGHLVRMTGHKLTWHQGVLQFADHDLRSIPEVATEELGMDLEDTWAFFQASATVPQLWRYAELATGGKIQASEYDKLHQHINEHIKGEHDART